MDTRYQHVGHGNRGVLYDDFEDNQRITRDPQVEPERALKRQYRRFRPVWGTNASEPTFANGRVEFASDGTSEYLWTHSLLDVGHWEFTFQLASSPTAGHTYMEIMTDEAGDNQWILQVFSGGNARMQKTDSGTTTSFTEATISDVTTETTVAVERDNQGNFEMLIDGVSQVTFTDSYLPNVPLLRFNSGSWDAEFRLKEVRVW